MKNVYLSNLLFLQVINYYINLGGRKMTNSKMTKRALLTSIMALMLCFAMLCFALGEQVL